MAAAEFGHFVLTIAALLAAVHGLGYLSERLKQPRIAGEILVGIVLGPFVLKLLAPTAFGKLFGFSPSANTVLGFLYQLGLPSGGKPLKRVKIWRREWDSNPRYPFE